MLSFLVESLSDARLLRSSCTIAPMQAQTPHKGKFTVALWHPPGQPAPERLLSALRTKGVAMVEVSSSYGALAEVCAQRTGSVGPDGKRPGSGIVIVYPERLSDASTLLEALWRYAPGTRCWGYGPASNPRLAAIVEQQAGHPGPDATVAPAPPATRPAPDPGSAAAMSAVEPKLKLTESGTISTASDTSDLQEDDDLGPRVRRPLLSAEELSMLLGEDGPEEGKT